MFKIYCDKEVEIRGRTDINRKQVGEAGSLDECTTVIKRLPPQDIDGEILAVNYWTGKEYHLEFGAWEEAD